MLITESFSGASSRLRVSRYFQLLLGPKALRYPALVEA